MPLLNRKGFSGIRWRRFNLIEAQPFSVDMEDYNIMDEAEAIATRHALRKADDVNVPDTEWAVMSDETKSLLIHIQQLIKSLEDASLEAVRQKDWERELELYQKTKK